MGWSDPGSTGGAVGDDGALGNSLTDPCWLLNRVAQLVQGDECSASKALPAIGDAMADALSALRHRASRCIDPLDAELVARMVTHLRLWANLVTARDAAAEAEATETSRDNAPHPRMGGALAPR